MTVQMPKCAYFKALFCLNIVFAYVTSYKKLMKNKDKDVIKGICLSGLGTFLFLAGVGQLDELSDSSPWGARMLCGQAIGYGLVSFL